MSGSSQWSPDYHAVSVMQRPDPAGTGATTISVRHPTDPYTCPLPHPRDFEDAHIHKLVKGYLKSLNILQDKRKIPDLGFSLASKKKPSGAAQVFTFLPLEDSPVLSKKSFWFDRTYGYDLCLMSVKTTDKLEGEGRYLVIVALVGDSDGKDLHIRIFDASGDKVVDKTEKQLEGGEMLTALKQQLEKLKSQEGKQEIIDGSNLSREDRQKIIRKATSSAGLTCNYDDETEEHTLIALATNASLCDEVAVRYGIRVVAHFSEERSEKRYKALITSMSAYLPTGANVRLKPAGDGKGKGATEDKNAPIFVNYIDTKPSREPASKDLPDRIKSRSPSGKEEILKQYFDRTPSYTRYVAQDSNHKFFLHEPSDFVRSDVNIEAYNEAAVQVRKDSQPVIAKKPPANAQDLRSDHFSAEKAYYNSKLLFERFVWYGIRPERYFRLANLPLLIHFRSGMPSGSGKDGQTVNAAVQPHEWRRHQIGPCLCESLPKLNMHFALANRSHRGRKKWDGNQRSPAQPMGIVADPRWVWHEFGHVLLMATTGELEMRFAHSPGDALAAIVEDPESSFVESTVASAKQEEKKRRWRGATFPWVYLPRRHDRNVKHGWSWSGAMHRPLRKLPDVKQPRRKGYRSEQILSTSLFRLYLCLGGMTPNDAGKESRQAASNYTLYLIIKGLGLLGDARIVAANHPDQLVSALIDADVGTEHFKLCEFNTAFKYQYPGGFAHKVIRWAFEAQGLYADGAIDNNDKGKPPAVDIYIEDGRPEYEEWCDGRVEHGKGSYVPVSLEEPETTVGSKRPDWFSDAIKVDRKTNNISVKVSNRGSEVATDVNVRVFYTQWDGSRLPAWESGGGKVWREAKLKGGRTMSSVNECAVFGPFTGLPCDDENYLILAEASCAADRANTDQNSCLPCSRKKMPLANLVANDNNLGLKLWRSASPKSVSQE